MFLFFLSYSLLCASLQETQHSTWGIAQFLVANGRQSISWSLTKIPGPTRGVREVPGTQGANSHRERGRPVIPTEAEGWGRLTRLSFPLSLLGRNTFLPGPIYILFLPRNFSQSWLLLSVLICSEIDRIHGKRKVRSGITVARCP